DSGRTPGVTEPRGGVLILILISVPDFVKIVISDSNLIFGMNVYLMELHILSGERYFIDS
ncbi:hypothetical protein DPMN_085784, partial [Dreissena polymorpha]